MADEDLTINGEKVSQIRERAREAYDIAYEYTAPHFKTIGELMNSYRSAVDRTNWPTLSNIMIPYHFTYVQQELPFFLEYLFPDEDFLSLTPVEEQLDGEVVRSTEQYYEHILRDVINIKKKSLNALQDAIKLNVGYIVIEPVYVNPKTRVERSAVVDGLEVRRDVSIEPSLSTKVQLSASYVPVGQVLSLGNGEGPDDGEHIVVRFRTAEELRNMELADELRVEDGKQKDVKIDKTFHGDVEEMLEYAKSNRLDSSYNSVATVMYELVSKATNNPTSKPTRVHTEPLVPVVEVYLRNEHIWLANGKDIIRHIKDDAGLLSPLVKFTPCKDYGEWFPYGKSHAGEDLGRGQNVFLNAILDLMGQSLHPARVVDTAKMDGDEIPRHGPYTTYKIRNGDARTAISFTQPPPLPQGAFEMMGVMGEGYDQAKGQPRALQGQGSAGLVRSGVGAFESLMATPHGRMKLGGAILEMDALEAIIERVIAYSSAVVGDVENFVIPRGAVSGDGFATREFEMMSIRGDDLKHVFRFSMNLREKLANSVADASMKMAQMNLLSGDPRIDQDALLEDFLGSKQRANKLKATPEKIAENLQMQQAQAQAQAQQNEQMSTPAEQAFAGQSQEQ